MIYGIGPRALGEQLGVDENDAAAFIETFKAKYPGTYEPVHNIHPLSMHTQLSSLSFNQSLCLCP